MDLKVVERCSVTVEVLLLTSKTLKTTYKSNIRELAK